MGATNRRLARAWGPMDRGGEDIGKAGENARAEHKTGGNKGPRLYLPKFSAGLKPGRQDGQAAKTRQCAVFMVWARRCAPGPERPAARRHRAGPATSGGWIARLEGPGPRG